MAPPPTQRPPLPMEVSARSRIVDARSAHGSLEMYVPAPAVLVTLASGHLDVLMADAWVAKTDVIFRDSRPLVVFNDWSAVESYDSAARRKLTSWVLDNRTRMDGAWFLTGSRIVAMGVAVAGTATALAGVTLHASLERPEWTKILLGKLSERARGFSRASGG